MLWKIPDRKVPQVRDRTLDAELGIEELDEGIVACPTAKLKCPCPV
jgi:hypothetical protein